MSSAIHTITIGNLSWNVSQGLEGFSGQELAQRLKEIRQIVALTIGEYYKDKEDEPLDPSRFDRVEISKNAISFSHKEGTGAYAKKKGFFRSQPASYSGTTTITPANVNLVEQIIQLDRINQLFENTVGNTIRDEIKAQYEAPLPSVHEPIRIKVIDDEDEKSNKTPLPDNLQGLVDKLFAEIPVSVDNEEEDDESVVSEADFDTQGHNVNGIFDTINNAPVVPSHGSDSDEKLPD